MARIPDLLDEEGPEDEAVIPPGLFGEEEEGAPEAPAVGGVAPPPAHEPKSADALLEEAFSYSPPPMVEAKKDTALADAQRADRRSKNQGRASDALYAAFSRRGLQNTGGGTDRAGELLKRRAVEQGEADKTRKAGERIADRASLAKALGVDEAQLAGLSDEGLSKVLGIKVGERKAAAATEAAGARAKAQVEADARRREQELADRKDQRADRDARDGRQNTAAEKRARIAAGTRAGEAGARREAAEEVQTQHSLEKYGEKVAAPAEEFLEQYAQVDEVMAKHAGSSDKPGVGFWDDMWLVPDFARSQDGLKLRKAAGQMMAAYQKLITGSGASDAERANLNKIGADLSSEKGFPAGLKALKAAFDAKMRALNASYDPAVPGTYKKRNPSTRMDLGGPAQRTPVHGANLGKVRVSNGAETLEIDEADLADAEAEGFKAVR